MFTGLLATGVDDWENRAASADRREAIKGDSGAASPVFGKADILLDDGTGVLMDIVLADPGVDVGDAGLPGPLVAVGVILLIDTLVEVGVI